jgi:hypothetical protein
MHGQPHMDWGLCELRGEVKETVDDRNLTIDHHQFASILLRYVEFYGISFKMDWISPRLKYADFSEMPLLSIVDLLLS